MQSNAEYAVRCMLKRISKQRGMQEVDSVSAVDYMDDGSVIALKLTIDRANGTAVFDFTGTSPESYGMYR